MQNAVCTNSQRLIRMTRVTITMAGVLCALAIIVALAVSLGLVLPQCAEAAWKRPANVAWAKAKATQVKTTVHWKRAKKVSGYQIRFSTKKNMAHASTKRISRAAKTQTTIRTKFGKTYWIQIRTYKTSHGKRICSKWSKRLRLRTPKRVTSNAPAKCSHVWTQQLIEQRIVTSPAWEELIPAGSMYYCNGCDKPFESTSAWIEHSDQMIDQGDMSHDSYRGPDVFYKTVVHPEESSMQVIGYQSVCSKCGEIVKG